MACRVSKLRVAVSVVLIKVLMLLCVAVVAQEGPKVVEVVITGNQFINTDTIINEVKIKPGDPFTKEAVEKDIAAIMELGYFSVVTDKKEEVQGGIKIIYEVTEFPKITDIKVVGSYPISSADILQLIKTKPGQVYNEATFIGQDINAIHSFYMDKGYIGYVTEDLSPPDSNGVLTIPIIVHTVESVEITGIKKTKEFVLLREMKTKPGTIFNRDVLDEDLRNIFDLDILETIKKPDVRFGKTPGTVRIEIPVVEKKTGQVSLGFGYSSKQRLVGQARLSDTNFRGRGQGLNLLYEQGTSEAVGGRYSYEISYYEPWLDKKKTSLAVTAFNKIIYRFTSGIFSTSSLPDDQLYNERHKGGELTFGRPLSEHTKMFLGGRFENVETDPNLLGNTGSDFWEIAQSGDVTNGTLRWISDTRDIARDPAGGKYFGATYEIGSVDAIRYGPPPTFTQLPFKGAYSKGDIDIRTYLSKGGRKIKPDDKRNTFAVRVKSGMATGKLPFFEQFFVGGAESLRGYREDRFWGKKMLLVSIEYRKPIGDAMTGVLFCDYGDAWDQPEEYANVNISGLQQHESFVGNVGVGIGLRVRTPLGHLRLDYGVGSEGGRTHFSMGQAF